MKCALIGLLLLTSAAFAQDKLMSVGMEMTDKTTMTPCNCAKVRAAAALKTAGQKHPVQQLRHVRLGRG